jgi:hypothetical protein
LVIAAKDTETARVFSYVWRAHSRTNSRPGTRAVPDSRVLRQQLRALHGQ